MAVSKSTRSRHILRFPQARGKTIELVELSASDEQYTIDIRFEDKTVLTFDLEPCVGVFPGLLDWKTGEYKLLKRWKPVYSRSSRV
jgi:hypothetical protein